MLGVEAAWRAGAGMVRYLGPDRPTALVLARRPETVTTPGRVQAWVIGSGTDAAERTDAETSALRELLAGSMPVVVDAGALALAVGASAPRIVTPHAREHDRLRAELGLPAVPAGSDDAEREASALQTAGALGATVLLKGAVTIVADPDGWSARVESGTPWLATAGTGDVLAGAMGAVLAGASGAEGRLTARLGAIAATAAWLHGRAGSIAADAAGAPNAQGPITALDVAAQLPRAVAEALAARAER